LEKKKNKGGRIMKEPIKRELSEKEYVQKNYMEKVIGERHFCPVCDKPSVEYIDEYLKDGNIDIGEPDFEKNACGIDKDTYSLRIVFIPHDGIDYDDEEEVICFSPEELGLNSKKYKERIENFIKNYIKNFNTKEDHEPIFCSTKCAKKFLIENIFQELRISTSSKREMKND